MTTLKTLLDRSSLSERSLIVISRLPAAICFIALVFSRRLSVMLCVALASLPISSSRFMKCSATSRSVLPIPSSLISPETTSIGLETLLAIRNDRIKLMTTKTRARIIEITPSVVTLPKSSFLGATMATFQPVVETGR